MSLTRLTLATVPLAALGLLAACGSDKQSDAGGDVKTVEVSLTENGCEPAAITATAGRTTFHVTNKGAAAVTEFEVLAGDKIVGEVENVAPGIDRKFTMTLAVGSYVTYCPGGKTEKGTLEVTAASGSDTTASGSVGSTVGAVPPGVGPNGSTGEALLQ